MGAVGAQLGLGCVERRTDVSPCQAQGPRFLWAGVNRLSQRGPAWREATPFALGEPKQRPERCGDLVFFAPTTAK